MTALEWERDGEIRMLWEHGRKAVGIKKESFAKQNAECT